MIRTPTVGMGRGLLLAALLLAVLPGLTACGLIDAASSPVFKVEAIQVRASEDANEHSATRLDLVFVYDPGVVDVLQSATAADWFSRKRQFLLDFPDGIGVKSWEVVPSSALGTWEVPEDLLENQSGDPAVAGFVFADFLTPGAHRARLETHLGLRIDLQRDDFTLTPFNPNS